MSAVDLCCIQRLSALPREGSKEKTLATPLLLVVAAIRESERESTQEKTQPEREEEEEAEVLSRFAASD